MSPVTDAMRLVVDHQEAGIASERFEEPFPELHIV
jgi:hypothetical protein